jgi:predicted HicB family RNase H-like nuclease
MQKPSTNFRFESPDHYAQIKQAAAKAGISLNAWIIRATHMALAAESAK